MLRERAVLLGFLERVIPISNLALIGLGLSYLQCKFGEDLVTYKALGCVKNLLTILAEGERAVLLSFVERVIPISNLASIVLGLSYLLCKFGEDPVTYRAQGCVTNLLTILQLYYTEGESPVS